MSLQISGPPGWRVSSADQSVAQSALLANTMGHKR